MRLYTELADWWPMFSAPEDYAEEAEVFLKVLLAHAPRPRTLLELGSGGGNNASFLKQHFQMTLTDISEEMLAVSRALNPECEHVPGDMRTVRVGKTFDGVFVHDAICYMTSESDLRRVFDTAFVHCAPGGVALFAPDWVRETFEPYTQHGGSDGEDRAVRYLEWVYDPDPSDSVYNVEYAVVLKSGSEDSRLFHERHVEGIFPKETWVDGLAAAGFRVYAVPDSTEPNRILFIGTK